jgi:hypothetical protein
MSFRFSRHGVSIVSEAPVMTSSISRSVELSSDVLRVRVYACICSFTPILYDQYSFRS